MMDFFAALNTYPRTALLCFIGLYLLLKALTPIVINNNRFEKDDKE